MAQWAPMNEKQDAKGVGMDDKDQFFIGLCSLVHGILCLSRNSSRNIFGNVAGMF